MGITRAPSARDTIPIWPDMQEPFALFIEAPWVWVPVGMSAPVRTHLNRTELEATARMMGLVMTPATFCDVTIMEAEALRYWSRKR